MMEGMKILQKDDRSWQNMTIFVTYRHFLENSQFEYFYKCVIKSNGYVHYDNIEIYKDAWLRQRFYGHRWHKSDL